MEEMSHEMRFWLLLDERNKMTITKSAVVAGHLCLDMLPDLSRIRPGQFLDLFQPGRLIQVGPALFSTGGPVSNTGLALHKLGIPTRLVAKIGEDYFGGIVQSLVRQIDYHLVEGITRVPEDHTSYSVVINPPGSDRIFLHSHGANDTFTASDINYSLVAQADIFHFGYPPIMRSMYQNAGSELVRVFRQAKETGVTTSLDMAFPDPSSESGQTNWNEILQKALPYVDIFLPSIDEILFMLRRKVYEKIEANGGILHTNLQPILEELSHSLIAMGAKIVGIKLGDRGFYLRTTSDLSNMGRASPADFDSWQNQQWQVPCFKVKVAGTTGSGDATIAGFLSALLRGLAPQQAATMAVAVGACNVEAVDALSGIRSWDETLKRVNAGWAQLE
jgi:sugar/nucleoside kinase (ribokinase family)